MFSFVDHQSHNTVANEKATIVYFNLLCFITLHFSITRSDLKTFQAHNTMAYSSECGIDIMVALNIKPITEK